MTTVPESIRPSAPSTRDGIRAFRRRFTLAGVERMRHQYGGILDDRLVAEVIDRWTAHFADNGLDDDVLLEACIRDALELAAAGRPWWP